MDDFEQRPNSPGGSRSPTPGPERRSKVADPFADPDANASSASLFVNETDGSGDGMTPLTPTQESFRQPPRPEPLDLPRPRTPPPRVYTPGVSRPPEPTRAPTMEAGGGSQTEEKPVRWWTEWLCGCREHGEEQVCPALCSKSLLSEHGFIGYQTGRTDQPSRIVCFFMSYFVRFSMYSSSVLLLSFRSPMDQALPALPRCPPHCIPSRTSFSPPSVFDRSDHRTFTSIFSQ